MHQTIEELKLGTYDNIATVCTVSHSMIKYDVDSNVLQLQEATFTNMIYYVNEQNRPEGMCMTTSCSYK